MYKQMIEEFLGSTNVTLVSDKWVRGGEPDWVYPLQARVVTFTQSGETRFAVFNEDGWDGYKEIPYFIEGVYDSRDEAWAKAQDIIS